LPGAIAIRTDCEFEAIAGGRTAEGSARAILRAGAAQPSRSRTPALPGRTCTSIFWRSPSPRRTCRRSAPTDHRAGDRLGPLHSQAIAPERTAWLIDTLGFKGRANHYAGAMWFYELSCAGNQYASAAIVFAGAPALRRSTTVTLAGAPPQHVT